MRTLVSAAGSTLAGVLLSLCVGAVWAVVTLFTRDQAPWMVLPAAFVAVAGSAFVPPRRPWLRAIVAAAHKGLDEWGFGLSSVRFICGTQTIHKQLEQKISHFLGTEDTILYTSCFDANGGLFETILGEEDAIISDELNHASVIDGIRLSKAQRFRYKNCDMADLEAKLQEASGARFKMIATDGVFSMDGYIAPLKAICDLADKYDAMVMVDDSHAVGFVGATGRGTHEHCGVMGRVDVITGTLGKALGGASGGYVSGRKEVVALLRQIGRAHV